MCPTVEPMSAPDPLHDLGVRAGADGGEIRVWSEHATSVDLVIFDADDLDWASERTPLTRDAHGVWSGASAALVPGAHYGLRVDGPAGFDHAFNPVHSLLDPYATGLAKAHDGSWRGVALAPLTGRDSTGAASASRAPRSTTRSSTRRTRADSRSSTPRSPRRCAAPTPVSPTTRRSRT